MGWDGVGEVRIGKRELQLSSAEELTFVIHYINMYTFLQKNLPKRGNQSYQSELLIHQHPPQAPGTSTLNHAPLSDTETEAQTLLKRAHLLSSKDPHSSGYLGKKKEAKALLLHYTSLHCNAMAGQTRLQWRRCPCLKCPIPDESTTITCTLADSCLLHPTSTSPTRSTEAILSGAHLQQQWKPWDASEMRLRPQWGNFMIRRWRPCLRFEHNA